MWEGFLYSKLTHISKSILANNIRKPLFFVGAAVGIDRADSSGTQGWL